ncbi:MAG: aminotransferase class IV, partial [archaeon]
CIPQRMLGTYFSHNGALKPLSEAKLSLDNIELVYGFGVYENLRVRHGKIFFPELHVERLLHSATILRLEHTFRSDAILVFLQELVKANDVYDANIKILLLGAGSREQAQLYIMSLNPLFSHKDIYKNGVKAILYKGEREFPQAKSLSMLMSYLAFREAKQQQAYDALLMDRNGCITEGTRTNIFFTDGRILYTPPAEKVLAGVTRKLVIDLAKSSGLLVVEKELKAEELQQYAGFFLTSTSAKILPLTTIQDKQFPIPDLVNELMASFDLFLDEYAERHT